MKFSNRAVGYLSFIAIIWIIGLVALGMWDAHRDSVYQITVDFTELGSLQPEDKVTIRGYDVGVVNSVTWLGDRSRVVLEFEEPVILREGTEIRDVNYALMGQRRIEIYPSKTGKKLPENYIHQGIFEPGVAEALRLIEEAVAQVEAVRQMALIIANGDSTHASFTKLFEQNMQKINDLLKKTEKISVQVPEQIDAILATADSATKTIVTISDQTSTTIHTIDSAVTYQIGRANNTVNEIKNAATAVDTVFDFIETNPTISSMLDSDSLIRQTEKLIAGLQDFIKVLDTKGLDIRDENGNKVPILGWKNLNIIGKTAREKARLRQELQSKLNK